MNIIISHFVPYYVETSMPIFALSPGQPFLIRQFFATRSEWASILFRISVHLDQYHPELYQFLLQKFRQLLPNCYCRNTAVYLCWVPYYCSYYSSFEPACLNTYIYYLELFSEWYSLLSEIQCKSYQFGSFYSSPSYWYN